MAINISKLLSQRKAAHPAPPQVFQNPWYFIAFGLGSGVMPFAPGTFGTLMAIPFYLLLASLPLWLYGLITVLFCIFSMALCDKLSREIHIHDHPGMCIDEFAGFFVSMFAAPAGFFWLALGFVLFRLFDIWKPWPIRLADEKIPGGFGMVFDDILAGISTCICLQLVHLVI